MEKQNKPLIMSSDKLIPILMTGLATLNASAGGRGVGNGGDVIVCPNSIEMLDSYEARIQRDIIVDFGSGYKTVSEATEVLLERLDSKHRHLKRRLESDARALSKDLDLFLERGETVGVVTKVFPDEAALTDVDDSEELVIPVGCQKVQFGIQTTPQFKEDKIFYVRGDITRKMSKEQLALFVMHEAIFRYDLSRNAENSVHTRYLNSLIASRDFPQMTLRSYLEKTKPLKMVEGLLINVGEYTFGRGQLNPTESGFRVVMPVQLHHRYAYPLFSAYNSLTFNFDWDDGVDARTMKISRISLKMEKEFKISQHFHRRSELENPANFFPQYQDKLRSLGRFSGGYYTILEFKSSACDVVELTEWSDEIKMQCKGSLVVYSDNAYRTTKNKPETLSSNALINLRINPKRFKLSNSDYYSIDQGTFEVVR